MCGGADLRVHFVYANPPPLETRFPLAEGKRYWRELHRCRQCGHYLEWFEADQSALYGGEYVSTTYGDAEGIRRTFEQINALPPERSDNIGRVRFVDEYCRAHWPRSQSDGHAPRLLDVGAGLGVFPHRMKQAGWDCTAMDMDERLIAHHRDVVGVSSVLGDVRTVTRIGEFDLIAFNKVLEHVVDPIGMLASVRRLLRTGGLVYVELPDGEGAELEGKEREEYLLGHIHVFSFASYALLIARAGFSLLCCERLREPSTKYTLRGFARVETA
jgi:2-polyprenyl-3-methyl-5-hydroxy-6-metoxy-1,4-benzoquinol methylase